MKIMPSVRTYTMHINSVHCLSVGVKFIMKNNKYIVQEVNKSNGCTGCDIERLGEECYALECSSLKRIDNKSVIFKKI